MTRLLAVAAALAIVAGAAARVALWHGAGELWLDEILLAVNILGRDYAGLLRPLDYAQAAPVGASWLMRIATRLPGSTEESLRLVPLLAGVALPGAMWFVGRRIAGRRAALLATILAAASPLLISYSAEAKQYALDPLLTLLVWGAALPVLTDPGDAKSWRLLAVTGLLALVLSHPALFVVTGTVLALMPALVRLRSSVAWRRWAITAGAWALGFTVLYFTVYADTAGSAFMQRYWERSFLVPTAPGFAQRLGAAASSLLLRPIVLSLSPVHSVVAAIAVVAGLVVIARRHSAAIVVLLVAPVVLAIVASSLRHYPMAARFLLFAAPMVMLAMAAALTAVVDAMHDARRAVTYGAIVATLLLLVVPPAWRRASAAGTGPRIERTVSTALATPDPGYVPNLALPAWAFYTTDWERPDTVRLGALMRAYRRSERTGALERDPAHQHVLIGLAPPRPHLVPDASELAVRTLEWQRAEIDRADADDARRWWMFGEGISSQEGAYLMRELEARGRCVEHIEAEGAAPLLRIGPSCLNVPVRSSESGLR